jgi:hypothetical protein
MRVKWRERGMRRESRESGGSIEEMEGWTETSVRSERGDRRKWRDWENEGQDDRM